jgi:anti-sigma B factor antagonist
MPGLDGFRPVGRLKATVVSRDCGAVVVLSGEADFRDLSQLTAVIGGQMSVGARRLTIDVSGLRFADTASIRTLILAAKELKSRGGSLVLLHPQQPVARVLTLLGADHILMIRTGADPGDGADYRS